MRVSSLVEKKTNIKFCVCVHLSIFRCSPLSLFVIVFYTHFFRLVLLYLFLEILRACARNALLFFFFFVRTYTYTVFNKSHRMCIYVHKFSGPWCLIFLSVCVCACVWMECLSVCTAHLHVRVRRHARATFSFFLSFHTFPRPGPASSHPTKIFS